MSEWYLSRNGEQEGPMAAEQIGELLSAGEIRASEALVWKDGMSDWKTVAESGVLSEIAMSGHAAPASSIPVPTAVARAAANPAQPQLATPTVAPAAGVLNPYAAPTTVTLAPTVLDEESYPGLGRLAYFGLLMGVSLVSYALLMVVVMFTSDSFGAILAGMLVFMLALAIGQTYVSVKRLHNLGMSGWAILWSLVPIMSIWISWRMFACPEGYEDHRQLDTAGKVLTGILISVFVLAFVANIAVAVMGNR